MKACVVLSPSGSKRLIAKGVAALPAVQRALEAGMIVITLGTTNAFVAEELLGESIDRGAFAAGFIDDRWNVNSRLGEMGEIVIKDGIRVELEPDEILSSLSAGDVLIKGGNAIDPWGAVGVLTSAKTGGTVGRYIAPAVARGAELVIPIGLGKTVFTPISEISQELGIGRIDLCMGTPAGMFPLHGRSVTEVDALELLFPVRATHVASGGVGPGAGSVSILIEGKEKDVWDAFTLVESLKGEPEVRLEGAG